MGEGGSRTRVAGAVKGVGRRTGPPKAPKRVRVVERDAFTDDLRLLGQAQYRLGKRSGRKAEALSRLIDLVPEMMAYWQPVRHDLGDGYVVEASPPEVTWLLREARRMGVVG